MFTIKYSTASLIFKPVLAEVRKVPQNPLIAPNSSSFSFSSGFFSSIRSSLFSTKIQGILPPSKKLTISSNLFFQFKAQNKT